MPGHTPDRTPLAARRAQLESRLQELTRRLGTIDAELDSHHDPDWSELAVQREGDEVLEATGSAGQAEIRQIHAALGRVEAGDYGVCVRCGEEIAEARLDLLPWTPVCRRCAK
jgi:RNA polymerase-binding transcription factor DksA